MEFSSPFDQVLGHEKAKRLLELAMKNPQHGYVITGPDGVGVHPLATAFVRVLADGYNGESLNAHPDILILQRQPSEKGTGLKKEISVQAVRELRSRVSERPTIASRLVIYIPDADYLNEEGVNALLKCIEEPSVNAVYVLAAHAVGRLPATLRSRVREIRLDRVPSPQITSWLQAKGISDSLVERALAVCDGRPGYAFQYTDSDEARTWIEEIVFAIKRCCEAKTAGEMVAAVSNIASTCDSAADPVTEWRKAIQLCQASLRSMRGVDVERVHAIGRALIAAERSMGSSIPPRIWLEQALVYGFRQPRPASLLLPHAFLFLPEALEPDNGR